MDGCLAKGRLHVVAPRGAGKTVPGLEMVRRLGRPAVVLVPTLAIREQWAHRLAAQFLASPPNPADLSRGLTAPAQLTLDSYQALDGLRRSGELDRLISALEAVGPLTLVLDEAHHLRRAWWTSLHRIAGGRLPPPPRAGSLGCEAPPAADLIDTNPPPEAAPGLARRPRHRR